MDSIELIRENLVRSEQIVLAGIEDMAGHGLVFPTPRGGCHTIWVLGHLAYIESLVIRTFVGGTDNPLASWADVFDGADVSGAPSDFPPFHEVLERCRAERAATVALLDSLAEVDLDRPSSGAPEGAEELFGTWRACFQYAADHWFMHRGQLADARRAAGLERAWY
jgi:hypothetical protein